MNFDIAFQFIYHSLEKVAALSMSLTNNEDGCKSTRMSFKKLSRKPKPHWSKRRIDHFVFNLNLDKFVRRLKGK